MESRVIETTAANGTMYQFAEVTVLGTVVMAYAWYCGKWNRLSVSFASFDEAQEWLNALNARYEARKNAPKTEYRMPQSGYYSITGYYGD